MSGLTAYIEQMEAFLVNPPAGYSQAELAFRDYFADHPGHPLGVGMPSGCTLREDGQSHRAAWMMVLRRDPCSYCDNAGGTIDHVEPRSRPTRLGTRGGGAHTWANYVGACTNCNGRKGAASLLLFLAACRNCPGASLKIAPTVA
jgi:HNH endonuclease